MPERYYPAGLYDKPQTGTLVVDPGIDHIADDEPEDSPEMIRALRENTPINLRELFSNPDVAADWSGL